MKRRLEGTRPNSDEAGATPPSDARCVSGPWGSLPPPHRVTVAVVWRRAYKEVSNSECGEERISNPERRVARCQFLKAPPKQPKTTVVQLRLASPFNQDHDWIFASPEMQGKQPYWPENLLRRHIRPAAKRCGTKKPIGWHTFRHSYATHLKANGEDIKVVQEALRHANSRITLDTYAQALTPAKREAQTKVVRMILPERTQVAVAGGTK